MSGIRAKSKLRAGTTGDVETSGRSTKRALKLLAQLQAHVAKAGVADADTTGLLNALSKRLSEKPVPPALRAKVEKNLRALVGEQGPRLRAGDRAEILQMQARDGGAFAVRVQLWARNEEEPERPEYKWQTVLLHVDGDGRSTKKPS